MPKSLNKASINNKNVILLQIDEIINTIKSKSGNNKLTIFSIASTANVNNPKYVFPAIRETDLTVCGTILINDDNAVDLIVKRIDGLVDIILVDSETKTKNVQNLVMKVKKNARLSDILTYKPNDLTVDAADALISQLFIPLDGIKISIIGGGNIGSKLALKLVERGADVFLIRRNGKKLSNIVKGLNAIKSDYLSNRILGTTNPLLGAEKAKILIGATPGIPVITTEMIQVMEPGGIIIDIGNGTLFPDSIIHGKQKQIQIICLNMKPGYDGAIQTIIGTQKGIKLHKSKIIGNITLISGGFLGEIGDIIVDNVDKPTRFIGIANGCGDVLTNAQCEKFSQRIEFVNNNILCEK